MMPHSASMSGWLATMRVPSAENATHWPAYFCSSLSGKSRRFLLYSVPSIQPSALPLLFMVRPPRHGLSQLYQDLRQRSSEPVDVPLGAERPRTDTDGAVGERAQGAVDIGGAVQPRADGDLERLVEDAADLRRRQRFGT